MRASDLYCAVSSFNKKIRRSVQARSKHILAVGVKLLYNVLDSEKTVNICVLSAKSQGIFFLQMSGNPDEVRDGDTVPVQQL